MDFLNEVVGIFLKEYPTMMGNIEKSVKERDGKGLQETAHALKGMLRSFAAEEASQTVKMLERMGQDKEFAGIDQVYQNLADEVEEFEKILSVIIKT